MARKITKLSKDTVIAAFAVAVVANEHHRTGYLMERNLSKLIRGDDTYNGFVTDLIGDNDRFTLMDFLEAMGKEEFIADANQMYDEIVGSKD